MKKLFTTIFSLIVVLAMGCTSHAEDTPKVNAIVDKAIKALGGEEKLSKINTAFWKSKNNIYGNGLVIEGSGRTIFQGLNHFRQEFETYHDGSKVKVVIVLAGDKCSRLSGENLTVMDKDEVANQKRDIYLTIIPITMLALKEKEFMKEVSADEKFGDKIVVGLKVIAAYKKEFKIYFDKWTGLPVKLVAKVPFSTLVSTRYAEQVTLFEGYKEMAGIKKATKITTTRNGRKFSEQTITEFKILDKVEAKTFTETK